MLASEVVLFQVLGVSILQSDPYMYFVQSQRWWQHDLHLPGYAFVVWLVNLIFFGQLTPLYLLHLVSALMWVASVTTFVLVLKRLEISAEQRLWLTSLYAFFPLLGVTFAAWPGADASVWLVVNLLVLACLEKRWLLLTAALAFGFVLHKMVWGFCGCVALYALFRCGYPWKFFVLSLVPLFVLWVGVALQGHGFNWMIQHDLERHFPSYSKLPVFDGILGTIAHGEMRNMGKGLLLLTIYVFEIFLFWKALRNKKLLAVSVLVPLLIIGAIVNQWLAIAVLRFGKISLLAVALLLPHLRTRSPSRTVFAVVTLFLLSSQFVYAFYMKEFFAEGGVLDQKLLEERQVMDAKGLPAYGRGNSGAQ